QDHHRPDQRSGQEVAHPQQAGISAEPDAVDARRENTANATRCLHRSVTDISPCALREGLTAISASCPSAVKNSMRSPTEKLPARLRMSKETCGCLMPSALPASACVIPRCLMMRYRWIVSSAFVNSCLGLGRPRSANTLPLLSVTFLGALFELVLVMSILPFSAVARLF